MGKIFGYLSGAGAGLLVVFAMASSATAIPEARTPSVGWLTELGTKAVAAPPVKVSTPEQPATPKVGIPDLKKPDPVATPDPKKPEPAKPAEPAKVATPDPKKPEPAKPAEPAKVATPEPKKPEPAKPAEPAKVATPEPKPAEPAKVATPEPAKPEPKPEPLVAKPPPPAPKPVAVAPAPKPAPPAAPAEPAEPEGVGTLNVNSEPPGAAVFLDGANVGQTPIEIDVPSGPHKIRAVHPTDGTDKKQSVTVKANGTATVQITF
jgi:hypothetical protein